MLWPRVPRCGIRSLVNSTLFCYLEDGHEGPHRFADGSTRPTVEMEQLANGAQIRFETPSPKPNAAESREALRETWIQRLWDMARFCRRALHDAHLISDDEFLALLQDSTSRTRLETYDQMRVKIAYYEAVREHIRATDWMQAEHKVQLARIAAPK